VPPSPVEIVLDVSSGSEAEDFGITECSFIGENAETENLRQRLAREEAKALKKAQKEEQKALKKAQKAAHKALKAVRKAEAAEALAATAKGAASPGEKSDPSLEKFKELCKDRR